jgi:hypothetical protein
MNSKSKIDKFFQDSWTETPVQYEGADFDTPADNRWIAVNFVPFDRSIVGIGGANSRKEDNALIVVRCYDVSPTLTLTLCQTVLAFIECKTINDIIVDIGIPDGNGAIPLHNGIFEMTLNFKTRTFT